MMTWMFLPTHCEAQCWGAGCVEEETTRIDHLGKHLLGRHDLYAYR